MSLISPLLTVIMLRVVAPGRTPEHAAELLILVDRLVVALVRVWVGLEGNKKFDQCLHLGYFHQCIVPRSLLWYISVHHYSNPDPTSDLTYRPNTHNSINLNTRVTMTLAFLGSLHNLSTWAIFHTQTKRS